jgi:hypothetical protein
MSREGSVGVSFGPELLAGCDPPEARRGAPELGRAHIVDGSMYGRAGSGQRGRGRRGRPAARASDQATVRRWPGRRGQLPVLADAQDCEALGKNRSQTCGASVRVRMMTYRTSWEHSWGERIGACCSTTFTVLCTAGPRLDRARAAGSSKYTSEPSGLMMKRTRTGRCMAVLPRVRDSIGLS